MSQKELIEELTRLQCLARAEGLELAFSWLGKAVAELMAEAKPKSGRRRGVWVRLARTGTKAFLPADVVEAALKEEGG